MKIYFRLLLLSLTLMYSCDSDDVEEVITEEVEKNKIDLQINGQPSPNRISGLTATLCCERKIYVSFNNFVDLENGNNYGGSGFSLQLDTSGNLLSLWYKTYGPTHEYYSPFFYPTSTLNITDFEFIPNELLKFRVNGRIFKRTNEFFAEPEFVEIDATIEIKEFHTCNCDSFISSIENYNNFVFYDFSRTQQGSNIRYFAYSNNGYQIEFLNFTEFIRNMPLGIYEFDEITTSERIDFRKFIGVPRAYELSIISQEWLKYETSGNFEIIEKQQIGSELIAKVKFNLTAKHNNEVIFQFNDVIMQTPF